MNKYILIADDNEGIVDILKTYVLKEGYTPIIAVDGESTINMFIEYSPILILLDVMMPKKMVLKFAGRFAKPPTYL